MAGYRRSLARFTARSGGASSADISGRRASRELPYFIAMVSPEGGHPRAIAVTKFRHAPYNIVGVIAENANDQWRVTSIVSTVDH